MLKNLINFDNAFLEVCWFGVEIYNACELDEIIGFFYRRFIFTKDNYMKVIIKLDLS